MCASVTWSLGATKFLPPSTCRGRIVKPAAVAAVSSTNLRRLIGEPAADFFGASFSKSLEEPFCGFSFFMIKAFYVKGEETILMTYQNGNINIITFCGKNFSLHFFQTIMKHFFCSC